MAGLDWCGKSRFHRDSIPRPSRYTDCAIPAHGQNECSQDANWYWQLVISVSTTSVRNRVCLSNCDPHCRKHVPSWTCQEIYPCPLSCTQQPAPCPYCEPHAFESTVSLSSYCRQLSLLPSSKWSPLQRHQSGKSRRKLRALPTYQINCVLK